MNENAKPETANDALMEKELFADIMRVDDHIAELILWLTGKKEVEQAEIMKTQTKVLLLISKLFEESIKPPVVLIEKAADEIEMPAYATDGAAGADIRAYLSEDVVIQPGERKLISTGLKAGIPVGYEIQVRPRSGLALKNGITVLNAPGTIDSDYKGDIGVILHNTSNEPFTVKNGERIAQIVVAKVASSAFMRSYNVGTSARGEGGFGSTGVQ